MSARARAASHGRQLHRAHDLDAGALSSHFSLCVVSYCFTDVCAWDGRAGRRGRDQRVERTGRHVRDGRCGRQEEPSCQSFLKIPPIRWPLCVSLQQGVSSDCSLLSLLLNLSLKAALNALTLVFAAEHPTIRVNSVHKNNLFFFSLSFSFGGRSVPVLSTLP